MRFEQFSPEILGRLLQQVSPVLYKSCPLAKLLATVFGHAASNFIAPAFRPEKCASQEFVHA
jgi:hypothetical protein